MIETTRKILERNWLEKREAIIRKMQIHSHDEALLESLAKEFDQIKSHRPLVQ